ncbi:cytochrome o ubiquinol oxidase subunit IV [Coxiella burnetii]|uniref:Cytochrome bo(3) ubiquinol oxidase subunit 4 n=2 Tax=Coxiella burnetii TaxID=777 RepID=B5QSA6_COXBU|nr:cytochrome o ubiquinol oxidase subunit IV [Coxiella burnetii]YP_002332979.1 cytochrome O ubiquinol oxidase protein [Coxiella burnetii RSA 493]ACI15270.1 cytochrome O ubiquinol oxidase protein [Coxiella burnetii RSA 493]ACI23138.1 cytochrome O ubiquinol oxidase protein [Coxiella burnetii Dugway 5J108-111]ACJ18335.1 cytochrome O ubiquinol oxidase protein [Coxiella burnetii CbuG_Q212]ACJ20049.1 cytochrome O ubiquinol oxidase protein [Coxiella burnetii CbuK_Q154]AIT63080.1 Cytochrome O ubiquin
MSAILSEESYGTGKKKLSIYIVGMILCVILTLVSFMTVMYSAFPPTTLVAIIFVSALIQFIVQVVCFLRLNAKNEQSRMNLMSFIFTIVILFVLIGGSLWIMWSLHYRMMH